MSISLRSALQSAESVVPGKVDVRMVAAAIPLHAPISVLNLTGFLQPLRLSFQLHAGTCSGSCEITLRSDGFSRYTGSVHDGGALSAWYTAITHFEVVGMGLIVIEHQGHVGGTVSLDGRTDTWDQTTQSADLAAHWPAVKAGSASATTLFGTDTAFTEVVDGLFEAGTGIFLFRSV